MLTHWRLIGASLPLIVGAFGVGLVVTGAYGLYQFFAVPPWDAYWMEQALLNDGLNSIGSPKPYEVRVFSTMNAPGPFAVTLMAGLLLLFGGRLSRWWPALALGLVAFALTLVRSSWGGFALGLGMLVLRLPWRLRVRYTGLLTLLVLLGLPFLSTGPLGQVLGERFGTLSDIQSDTSFNDRLGLYAESGAFLATRPLGAGLGATGVGADLSRGQALQDLDSGLIALAYSFGLLGTLYFAAGAFYVLGVCAYRGFVSPSRFERACAGVTVATGSQLIFGNSWTGVAGMGLWFFAACGLAALIYRERGALPQPAARLPESVATNFTPLRPGPGVQGG